MKKCPFCDEMIDDGLSVCPICGEELGETSPPKQESVMEESDVVEKRECPICGEMIDAHLDVCDICGEPTHFHDVQEEPTEVPEIIEETESITSIEEAEPVTTVKQDNPVAPVERPAVKQQLPEEGKKKSNRSFIIGLLALLLLAICGLLYLLFFKGDQEGKLLDGDDIELPMDSIQQDTVKGSSIQAVLDNMQSELNEDVIFVAKYPDEDRACMYYLFNGELFKYNALNGLEETVSVPMDSETDVVLFAEPVGDGEYIRIDMGNENMEHTAFYRLNTQTGKIVREKESEGPAEGQKPQGSPDMDGKNPGDMPPPPPTGGNNLQTKGNKNAGAQKQAPPPPAPKKVRPQQRAEEEVPPPPPSNGPGYRLEPINKGDIPKGNNNGGYHF